MKNLLIITNLFPNSKEKSRGIFIQQLTLRLKLKFNITVIAPIASNPISYVLHYFTNQLINFRNIIDNINIYHPYYFITPKIFRSLYGFFFFIFTFNTTRKILNKYDIDMISAHWVYPDAFSSILFSKIFKKKIAIHALGCDINEFKKFYLRRKLIAYALNNSDLVICKSNELLNTIKELSINEKIYVAHNGVDRRIFKYEDKKLQYREELNLDLKTPTYLFVGNLQDEKNPRLLLESFKLAYNKNKNKKLIIIGNGPLNSWMQTYIKNNNLSQCIHTTKHVGHNEITKYIQSADFLCMTSKREGCPNIALESLSCGTPIISTDVGAIPEIIYNNDLGIIVNTHTALDYSKAMEAALEKKWDIRNDFKWITWEENALLIESLYQTHLTS